ncbi:hypothetical protein VTH06DRAFT_6668 [Thermothelomyces fergusii]
MSPPAHDEKAKPAKPEIPRRATTTKHASAATPTNKRASAPAAITPKSAPAAPGNGSSHKKKPEPSLLNDFLLGRPSPARVAAQRGAIMQRRKSMSADAAHVREELRREMREAAVRRIPQPGGVRERVKAWQKASAAAMRQEGGGVPHAEDAASEPTEVAAHLPPESVTEEDRVRIKMRQKPKKKAKPDPSENKEDRNGGDGDEAEKEKPAVVGAAPSKPPVVKSAPKKRIVSDDNWMKGKKGPSTPQNGPAGAKTKSAPASGLPKDFLQRTAQNPSVQSKIRDWVQRVEVPEPPPPKVVKHYRHKKSGATVTVEEDPPSVAGSDPGTRTSPNPSPADDDGIQVRPMEPEKPNPDHDDDGIRVKPMEPRPDADDDDAVRVTPVTKKEKEPLDDGIRVQPVETKIPDDGIRVRPIDTPPSDDGSQDGPRVQAPVDEPPVRSSSPRPPSERGARSASPSPAQSPDSHKVIEVEKGAQTEAETPATKRKVSKRAPKHKSHGHGHGPGPGPKPATSAAEPPEIRSLESDTEQQIPPSHAGSDDDSDIAPSTVLGNKSLAEIPFGYSAFSVLDLPLGADARNSTSKRLKAQRNPSLKTVPKVIKKVVTGAKDIIQEMAEPPKPVVTKKPQSIESWLNETVDPADGGAQTLVSAIKAGAGPSPSDSRPRAG